MSSLSSHVCPKAQHPENTRNLLGAIEVMRFLNGTESLEPASLFCNLDYEDTQRERFIDEWCVGIVGNPVTFYVFLFFENITGILFFAHPCFY